jgi:hypothetical protein
MATYYKYAERSADSQVNWAEVGKGISDMLTEGAKLREEKKAAYEEAYRIDTERLINAPQGTWQDGNATVNNFAHDMMAQQLIDYRLLKNGIMSERDYTLRRENYKSGTNTVFDLQKILQAEKAKTIEAYQKGEIQAMNISNMADVEAYTDFANSKIEIDPYNPNINMSIYETKMVDGKEVRVIKNTSPVNVLKGQLLQKIPAFKLDEAVTKDVNSLGVGSDFLYEAATTSKAGSITKLIGYGAIAGEYAKKDKNGNPLYPQFADEVSKMKDAITQTVNKYFSDPYAVSSILTENTGNYSAESYTVYKEEAAKDKTKLLKKLDPMTGQYVLDKDGPHYKEQEQEAREYVEKLILSKLDAKRELATTAQTQLQERRAKTAAEIGQETAEANATNVAENLIFATTGNANQADSGTKFFTGLTGLPFNKTKDGISITNEDGNLQTFRLRADGKTLADPLTFMKSFIGPIAKKTGLNQDDILREVKKLLPQGARLNETTVASGFDEQAMGASPFESLTKTVDVNMDEPQVTSNIQAYKKATDMAEYLNSNVAPNLGLDVSFSNGLTSFGQSIYVEVGGKSSPNFAIGTPAENKLAMRKMKKFLIDNLATGATPEEKDIAAEEALRNMRLPEGSATTNTETSGTSGTVNYEEK